MNDYYIDTTIKRTNFSHFGTNTINSSNLVDLDKRRYMGDKINHYKKDSNIA